MVSKGVTSLNPSASLVAFILDYAEPNSMLYIKACMLSQKYVDIFVEMEDFKIDPHLLYCVLQMYETLRNKKIIDSYNYTMLEKKVILNIVEDIKANLNKWGIEYCLYPSMFIKKRTSFIYDQLIDCIMMEIEHIRKSKINEGEFKVTWQWHTPYKEFDTSKIYWQVINITNKLEFIREFNNK